MPDQVQKKQTKHVDSKKKKEEAEIETTDITKIKEGWEECTKRQMKRKRRFRDSKSESFSANESVNIWILIILKFQ